ncbi:hypothetical protein BH20ACT2_BH20ACT2_04100 [soil metagenome]
MLLLGVVAVAAAITVPRLVGGEARGQFEAALEGEAGAPAGTAGWERLRAGPMRGDPVEVAVWTGKEVVLWGDGGGAAFDPGTRSWRSIADPPISPLGRAAGDWTDEALAVVAFGCAAGDPCDDPSWRAAAYDPAADRWRTLAPPPLPDPAGPTTLDAVWTGDRLLVLAGERSVAYEPGTDRWDPRTATVPVESVQPSLLAADARVELWDGRSGPSDTTSFSVTVHDGAERRWGHPLPPLPSPVPPGPRSLTVVGDQVVALAGTTAVAYERAANAWGTLPDLPVALGDHLAVWTGDELLVAGVDSDGHTLALSYRAG